MKKWIINGLLVVFIAVFLVSGYFLAEYLLDSFQQQAAFDDLADIRNQATTPVAADKETAPPIEQPADTTEETLPEVSPYVEVIDPETGEVVELLPEFVELYGMNNDIVGWISVPGTKIDYPVMQTPDHKDFYLRKDFYGEYNSHGTIYASEYCDVFAPSDNLTIYGHRMKDGTMFFDLTKYEKKSFWEKNPIVHFDTLTEHRTYEIFAIFKISSSIGTPFPYHQFIDAANQEEFDEYIAKCQKYALYDTGIVPQHGDKLITLSTCEYTKVNGRLVVVAVQTD